MKRLYVFVCLGLTLAFFIVSSRAYDSRTIVISRDVKNETKNMIKSYYISQRNEAGYMPLAEDDLPQDYSLYSSKFESEEDVNIEIIKGDTE